jgi:hypothetical protein
MSREFTVGAGGTTIAGATTLSFVNPIAAPNINLEFLRAWVGQSANATSAQQRVQLETQVTVFPTLTSKTPEKLKRQEAISTIVGGTAGAAGTAGVNASVEGAGGKTAIFDDAFNVLNGYLWVPTPNETIVLPAGFASGLGLFLPVAPATLTNWTWGLNFAER